MVNGYAYPHIEQRVLRQAMPYLTDLSLFSYGFREDGALVPLADSRLLAEASLFGAGAVLVLTSIDESGTFSSQRASHLFQDQRLQEVVLDQLLLAPKTHAQQSGPLYAAHDYSVIGAIADSVLLMTYEWGYAYGPPMAVAPLPQVEEVLQYGVTEIAPGKIQLGIPNYGYDWTLPYEPSRRAATIGNQEAVRLAGQVGAEIQFDTVSQAPYFRYTREGIAHQVWFEDARSIQAKLQLALQYGIGGVAYWNLLRPFSQNWALLSQKIRILNRREGP